MLQKLCHLFVVLAFMFWCVELPALPGLTSQAWATAGTAPAVAVNGTLTDDATGMPLANQTVGLDLLQYLTPTQLAAYADQGMVLATRGQTDANGHYDLSLSLVDIPPDYVAPNGTVSARLFSNDGFAGDDSPRAWQAIEFNIFSSDGSLPDHESSTATTGGAALAIAEAGGGGSGTNGVAFRQDLVAQDPQPGTAMNTAASRTRLSRTPSAQASSVSSAYDYCLPYYAEPQNGLPTGSITEIDYKWVAIPSLTQDKYASVGRVRTKGTSYALVGAYNGNSLKTENFAQIGPVFAWARVGTTTTQDTSVDWSVGFPHNADYELFAQIEYRYHTLECLYSTDYGYTWHGWYPSENEFYPYRPTAGTKVVSKSGEPFSCASSYETSFAGTEKLNVSRGKTRTTSDSFAFEGVAARVSLTLSTSTDYSSTTVTRHSYWSSAGVSQSYTLCGSNDIPAYATWVREK